MSQELRIVFILPFKGTKDHEMYERVREGDGMRLKSEFFEYWRHSGAAPPSQLGYGLHKRSQRGLMLT